MAIEALEQRLDQVGLGQRLTEQPHRGRIGHDIFQAKSQKAHEREPVADLILDLLIGQVVKRLQHQNLEHHDGVEGFAAGLALPLRAPA